MSVQELIAELSNQCKEISTTLKTPGDLDKTDREALEEDSKRLLSEIHELRESADVSVSRAKQFGPALLYSLID